MNSVDLPGGQIVHMQGRAFFFLPDSNKKTINLLRFFGHFVVKRCVFLIVNVVNVVNVVNRFSRKMKHRERDTKQILMMRGMGRRRCRVE